MNQKSAGLRAGVYVDVENIARNGGRGMRFDTLRDYARRDGADAIRLNAYLAFDEERAQRDYEYRNRATRYHFAVRDVGFKVIEKSVQWFNNEDGARVSKANSDLDLAVDMLLQSAKLDRVVLVSGDGDFVQVVRALQNMGCRVELIGFQNVSYQLRCECDVFVSGYLIPGLLPSPLKTPAWGEPGARVRGTCYHYNAEKGFGFLRYLARLGDLTITDTREPDSPYREAFFHRSQCPPGLELNLLPNRDMVFDFTLVSGREGKIEANELNLIANYSPHARSSQANYWLTAGTGEGRLPRALSRPTTEITNGIRPDTQERQTASPVRIVEPRLTEVSYPATTGKDNLPGGKPDSSEENPVSPEGDTETKNAETAPPPDLA